MLFENPVRTSKTAKDGTATGHVARLWGPSNGALERPGVRLEDNIGPNLRS